MARERESYRAILEDLLTFNQQKRLLSTADVARYLGIDWHRAKKLFGLGKDGITAPDLARRLAEIGGKA